MVHDGRSGAAALRTRERCRRLVAAGSLLVLALVASACGGERQVASGGGSAEVVNRHADWWLVDEPAADDVELRVRAITAATGCDEFLGLEVREGDDEVHVEAMVRDLEGDGCGSVDPGEEEFTVTLREPLGDRGLVGCVATDPELRSPELGDHDDLGDCRDRRLAQ